MRAKTALIRVISHLFCRNFALNHATISPEIACSIARFSANWHECARYRHVPCLISMVLCSLAGVTRLTNHDGSSDSFHLDCGGVLLMDEEECFTKLAPPTPYNVCTTNTNNDPRHYGRAQCAAKQARPQKAQCHYYINGHLQAGPPLLKNSKSGLGIPGKVIEPASVSSDLSDHDSAENDEPPRGTEAARKRIRRGYTIETNSSLRGATLDNGRTTSLVHVVPSNIAQNLKKA